MTIVIVLSAVALGIVYLAMALTLNPTEGSK